MRKRHFAVPTVQTGMSEADLDKFCREYLQALVDNNLAVGFFYCTWFCIFGKVEKRKVLKNRF